MKDPLQTERSPWDILGITSDVSRQELDQALISALRNGVPGHVANRARQDMLDPMTRAWWKLLEYPSDALDQLPVNPMQDPSALELSNRIATCSAWETHLREVYPAADGTTHCLAVLFYWSVLAEEERLTLSAESQTGTSLSFPAALFDVWRGSIAYWSMLLVTPDFWRNGIGISNSEEEVALKQTLKEALHNRLQDQAQAFSSNSAITAEYRKLQTTLAAELDSARAIAKYGAKTEKGTIRAGLMGLERLGYLEQLRKLVDERHQQYPNDQNTSEVRGWLSVHLDIHTLIRNDKPDEALARIEGLPATDQRSAEVCELRARALFQQGKHRAEVGKIQVALECWQNALGAGHLPKELRKQVESEVISTCHSRATTLQDKQPDEAIAMLELGLRLVPDSTKLKECLAEILTGRAITVCVQEQTKVDAAVKKKEAQAFEHLRQETLPKVRQAVHDLEWAADLGSARAKENLIAAQSFLESLEGEGLSAKVLERSLPETMLRLLAEARVAADAKGDHEAVRSLKRAVRIRLPSKDAAMKRALAAYLCNQAVELANEVVHRLDATKRELDSIFKSLFEPSRTRDSDRRCANCGSSGKYLGYGREEELQVLQTHDGKRATVCAECSGKITHLQFDLVCADMHFGNKIRLAEQEIIAAIAIDPSYSHASEQLQSVRAFMQQCGIKSYKPRLTAWIGNLGGNIRGGLKSNVKAAFSYALVLGLYVGADYGSVWLFHTKPGTVFVLLFVAVPPLIALCSWLSSKWNEISRPRW